MASLRLVAIDASVLAAFRESSAALESVLRVYVVTDATIPDADAPSVAGEYSRDAETWVFRPLFPPEPGVTYRAVLRVADKPLTADFTVAARPAAAATLVKHVYPTADKLPENLLKFYVHFTAPMRRGRIYDHIRLLEASGQEVELPFLEIDNTSPSYVSTPVTSKLEPAA